MALNSYKNKEIPAYAVVRYNDRYFRAALSLLAGHIIVMYDEPDTFFQAVFTESYWRGLIASFVISLALTAYIHFLTMRLDRTMDWKHDTLQRLFWQAFAGFFLPAIAAFLLAAGFFSIYGINILKTSYLSKDYTVILLMLLVVNVYYFGIHSFLMRERPGDGLEDNVQPVSQEDTNLGKNTNKEVLIVNTVTGSVPVPVANICYIYILNGNVFLRTQEMAAISESIATAYTLKALEEWLDRRRFFRINRRMIVSFSSCGSYRPGKNKTLELLLEPPPYPKGEKVPKEHERLGVVSEDRVQDFKEWMNR